MLRWFESRLSPYPIEEPVKPPTGLLAFCWHYSKGATLWLAVMAFAAVVIAILEIVFFGFLASIVNWLGTVNRETLFQDHWPSLAGMAVVLLVIYPFFAMLSSMTIHQTLLGNLPQRIRWQAHRYLLRQSMTYFQNEFAGRIATKLMQTSLAVREVVMKVLDMLVYVGTYFVGAVVFAAWNDWRFGVPFAIWLLIYFALLFYFVPRLAKIAQSQADARSMMTGRIVDSYTNISTVKLFSHAQREEGYANEAMDGFLQTVYRQFRLVTKFEASITALNLLAIAAIVGMGLYLWSVSLVTAGAVAAAVALMMRMNNMSHWIMWEMAGLFENIGTVRDGINSIALDRAVEDKSNAIEFGRVTGEIRFDGVYFHYEEPQTGKKRERKVPVIDDLNLSIAPGEKIGLVGRSGAGKSTIVNLILRFYDVQGGAITIDGTDIAQVTQESLRANIGVVTQDTSLLHRSVRDNIVYGRPDATEDEMVAAAKLAEADEFIHGLRDAKGRTGYDAHVGERGVKLSGGQRQRIAIARVLLKDAPILVLDEATSALDSEVEAAIQGQLQHLMQNKTVIAIAHRLSTIAAMDRLIVLDNGQIIEQGSHEQLLAQNGTYAKLWAHQSGGFLNLDDEESEAAAQ